MFIFSKRFIALGLLLYTFSTSTLHPAIKVIIWDLGETLLTQDKRLWASNLGYWNAAIAYLWDRIDIRTSLWNVLNTFSDQARCSVSEALDPQGVPQPILMRDWLAGLRSSQEMKDISLELTQNYQGFKNDRHKEIVANTFTIMFTPARYASLFQPTPLVKVLQECAASQRYLLMIASNFDPETFDEIRRNAHNNVIFDLIKPENTYVSGYLHLLKPQQEFFERLLQGAAHAQSSCLESLYPTYEPRKNFSCQEQTEALDSSEIVFIDDQSENIEKARQLGMHAIKADKNDPEGLRKALRELGVDCAEETKQSSAAGKTLDPVILWLLAGGPIGLPDKQN
jgi:FMN phosphatase YigB (HAD superfamily)